MFDKIVSRVSKVLVLIVLLFVVACISVFCVIPVIQSYITRKPAYQLSFPTATPESTSTPKPTETEDVGLTYAKAIYSKVIPQKDVFNKLEVLLHDVSEAEVTDQSWKNNIYSYFDQLISSSDEAAKIPCPAGYEEVQKYLKDIHSEYLDAKHDIFEALEYRDEVAIKKTSGHLQTVGTYYEVIGTIIEQKEE